MPPPPCAPQTCLADLSDGHRPSPPTGPRSWPAADRKDPALTTPAQITLALSRTDGIVAIANGEWYAQAQTALALAGFRRRPDGTYVFPPDDPDAVRAAVTGLVRAAHRHRTTVTTSSRRYLGDVADAIAAHLPGTWSATVDVYSHPVWQEDLLPWLWDAGELSRTVQSERIPHAAVLSDSHGIELLLIERPGHHHGYVIGAFAPAGFGDNHGEPHAPSSIVIPAHPVLASYAVTGRFLPACHQALHARRTATVASALARIREEHQVWQAAKESGRASDGTPIDPGHLPGLESRFADHAWDEFRDLLTHAPALLERCRPADTEWPQDAAALGRLRDALDQGAAALTAWNARLEDLRQTPASLPAETYAEAKEQRNARVRSAIDTWRADGDALLRQARAVAPHQRSAPAISPPAPALPPARPSPRR